MIPVRAVAPELPIEASANEAKQAVAAVLQAAKSRLELFHLEYAKDERQLQEFAAGVTALMGLLVLEGYDAYAGSVQARGEARGKLHGQALVARDA